MSTVRADPLTALDAAFLHIERDGVPVHIGSIGLFEAGPLLDGEGRLRLDEIRAQVVSRLDVLPHLRCRIAEPALGLGRPAWVDDPTFDVVHHVDAVDLPGGTMDDLRHLAEELFTDPLPSGRPLWHLRFVTGLTEARIGLVERVHHALVDGVSGVDVALVLLDLTPEVTDPEETSWEPAPAPSPSGMAARALASQLAGPVRVAASAAGTLLQHPTRLARGAVDLLQGIGTLVADGITAPRSALNQPIGPRRSFTWCAARLEDVKAAGKRHGATTNDVVLAATAHGLRALLLERGEVIEPDDVLKVLVPVSVRSAEHRGALGNEVGALVLRLPIGVGDPVERLHAVARATSRLKAHGEAAASQLLLSGADLLPAPLLGPLAHLTDEQRLVNLIVTNVPGPGVPLYCRGARLLETYPVVPLGPNFGLSVAILSYDGTLSIGVTTDPDLVPDVEVLAEGIEAGLATLDAAWKPVVRSA